MKLDNGVLMLVLLFFAARQAESVCNLCFDGEAITKPEYSLDIKEPVPVGTCQDLVSILALIPKKMISASLLDPSALSAAARTCPQRVHHLWG